MNFFMLTKTDTFIIGPVANLLGWIMNLLFEVTSKIGIENIGLCIILFTLIIKLLMFPLTIKQQKSSKLMSIMNPEIQAVQKKYKGKTDQASLQKQQAETKAIYDKYGTSATGGCLQLLIQMPILFALYRVIANIPAYVDGVRIYFDSVAVALQGQEGFISKIADIAKAKAMAPDKFDLTIADKLVDLLYKFTPVDWNSLSEIFPSISNVIVENSTKIIRMNQFLGLNLADSPGFRLTPALIIPVLAGLSQWVSTKLMSTTQETDPDSPTAASMKTMNNVMPLMSAFFCIQFPIGMGIYWIASSVFQIIQQLIVNSYMNKIDINDMIAKNVEKANKKRAKKGLPPQKLSNVSNVGAKNLKEIESTGKGEDTDKKAKTEEKIKQSTEYYSKSEKNPNSLAAKAAMVKKYNEKNSK